jgi:hypothetical protein
VREEYLLVGVTVNAMIHIHAPVHAFVALCIDFAVTDTKLGCLPVDGHAQNSEDMVCMIRLTEQGCQHG